MKIKRILRDEKGAVLPLVALFLFFVALGVAALVIDVGMMNSEKRKMVTAADAGALAGAREMQKFGSEKDKIEKIAEEVAKSNGANGLVIATANMGSDPHSIHDMEVKVEVVNTIDLFFAKAIDVDTADIFAYAIAKPMRLNPAIFPIGIDKTKAYGLDDKPKNGLIYLHGDKDDPSYYADLLNLDGKSGGASAIIDIIVDRHYKMGDKFAINLTNKGIIESGNGWKTLKESIETLFDNAYEYSNDIQKREAYMTVLAPVYESINKSEVKIYEFAEIVIVDKISPSKKDDEHKGVIEAFPVTVSGNTVTVDYTKQVGKNNENLYPKQGFVKEKPDVVVAYFTGTTVSIDDVLNGNYQGTLYNRVKFNAVSLVE